MELGSTHIEDTFAEAFGMRYCRLLITAADRYWLEAALREVTGFSTSVIACDVEAGVEERVEADRTLDGRCGAHVLLFGFSSDALAKAVPVRVGQCVMTCATTAVYNALEPTDKWIGVGKQIRFFGDGFQKSKRIAGRRFWRVPVMDGEFLVEDRAAVGSGVAGGNFIVQADSTQAALAAVRRAVEAIDRLPGVITPFPGGVARSGSKVGSRYRKLRASTADAYCPTLRGRVASRLHPQARCALEIVLDGIDAPSVAGAMAAGIRAAAGEGILVITAGNYGGKLGKFQFALHSLLQTQ